MNRFLDILNEIIASCTRLNAYERLYTVFAGIGPIGLPGAAMIEDSSGQRMRWFDNHRDFCYCTGI